MTNLERTQDAYAAYNRRDFSFVDELFAEDIEWSVPDGPHGSGKMRGREAVHAFFDALAEEWASHTIALEDAVESGDRLVCFVRHTFTRRDGGGGDVESVHDWAFRDGRIVRLREVADTLGFAVAAGAIDPAALQQPA